MCQPDSKLLLELELLTVFMSNLTSTFAYSIGKKLIMALTGLFLITFLVVHLAGNLLLFVGQDAFDAYAEFMGHNPVILVMEIVLFGGFLFHIFDGLWLALQNKKARPQKYAVKGGNKSSSWLSRNMAWTGTIMLVFLILHLISFWLKGRFGIDVRIAGDYGADATLYEKTKALFEVPWYSILYVVAMVFIAFHLNHGFQSAFRTMGWVHAKYMPIVKFVGTAYAILIPAAFASIPLYFLINSFIA